MIQEIFDLCTMRLANSMPYVLCALCHKLVCFSPAASLPAGIFSSS
mgnify:CR=1 FL=1